MSVKYSNQYNAYHPGGLEWDHATSCDWARRLGDGQIDDRFLRVEMRINGHWHRPPVGMRADQASHAWTKNWNVSLKRVYWTLELVMRA